MVGQLVECAWSETLRPYRRTQALELLGAVCTANSKFRADDGFAGLRSRIVEEGVKVGGGKTM